MVNNLKELSEFSKSLKILYVEDNQEAREQTIKMLKKIFIDIIVAIDGQDGLNKFKQNKNTLDIIFTDINMPNMNGIEMLKSIRKVNTTIPCVVLSAHNETNFFLDTISLGVDGYILKPVDMQQFITILTKTLEQIKLKKENIKYKETLEDINNDLELQVTKRIREIYALNQEIEDTQKEVVFTMGAIGESRSKETGHHVKRVAEYSKVLALKYGLNEADAELLKQASPMHDIGKIAIPDSILNKPGRFDKEERKIMDTHSDLGYEMLNSSKRPLLKVAAIVAHQHHEKWDGSGYPQGLKGEDIDINGRITAVADVFDALGSDRVYKKAWEDEKIFNLFKEERGKHFDPKLVDIFFDNLDTFLGIRDKYK
ncbi:MAG: response regulator [Campylobacterota bacterium]|nr:response regulator [Campylobacterota bacterium]